MRAHAGQRWYGRGRGAAVLLVLTILVAQAVAGGAASAAPAGGASSAGAAWRPLAAVFAADPAPAPRQASELLTITATAGTGAWITPEGAVKVQRGKSQVFTFGANAPYQLTDVVVDGVPKGPIASPFEFNNVTADHTIVVKAAAPPCTIAAKAGEGAWITPEGDVKVPYGGSQTFDFGAKPGHHVTEVLIDDKAGNPAATSAQFLNVTENHTIAVAAAPDSCTITTYCGPNGRIEPSGNVKVPYGEKQTFVVTPDPHYQISGIFLDRKWLGTTSPVVLTNVVADHELEAYFERDGTSFLVSASVWARGGGTISPSGDVWVPKGEDKSFSTAPAPGYDVLWVKVDGVDQRNAKGVYWLRNVAEDHTIVAAFAPSPVTITASASEGGTITPSGAVQVPLHGSRRFDCASRAGYDLESLIVDGVTQPHGTTTYTFEDVVEEHVITATFLPVVSSDRTPPVIRLCTPLRSTRYDDPRLDVIGKPCPRVPLVEVTDEAGGSGVAEADTTADVVGPGGARVKLDLVPYRRGDTVVYLGVLPTDHDGRYSLNVKAFDKAGNPAEKRGYYAVAGSARVLTPPSIDLMTRFRPRAVVPWTEASAAPSAAQPVTLTVRVRTASGRPVRGATPRLFAYDEASSTCLFRAARLFTGKGAGVYTYTWQPAKLSHDAGWGHEWRTVQLLIPLDGEEPWVEGPGAGREAAAKKPTRPTMAFTTVEVRW